MNKTKSLQQIEMSDGLHTDSGYTDIGFYKISGLQFKQKCTNTREN